MAKEHLASFETLKIYYNGWPCAQRFLLLALMLFRYVTFNT